LIAPAAKVSSVVIEMVKRLAEQLLKPYQGHKSGEYYGLNRVMHLAVKAKLKSVRV